MVRISFHSITVYTIKTVYRPLLCLTEPTFDNIEKLNKIKHDVSSKNHSEIVFRERLVLDIETGPSLLIDDNNLCKTIKKISVYDNSLGRFVEILSENPLSSDTLNSKNSFLPNIYNINWLIHSQKGITGRDDTHIVQGVLQVVLRKLQTKLLVRI